MGYQWFTDDNERVCSVNVGFSFSTTVDVHRDNSLFHFIKSLLWSLESKDAMSVLTQYPNRKKSFLKTVLYVN